MTRRARSTLVAARPEAAVPPESRGAGLPRWYLRADWATNLVLHGLRGLVEGFWLGVLSRDQWRRIDEEFYSTTAQYYDERYNGTGLFGWERAAVDKHFGGATKIVVTSAGAGREILALAAEGRRVIGYEPHRGLVEEGWRLIRSAGHDGKLLHQSPRDRWPTGATGDAAIVGWGAYMLMAGRETRVRYLAGAAAALPPGAPVLLSFVVRPYGEHHRFATSAAVATFLRRFLKRDDLTISTGDALHPGLVHMFTRDQIANELAEGGFELVEFSTEPYGWAVGRKS